MSTIFEIVGAVVVLGLALLGAVCLLGVISTLRGPACARCGRKRALMLKVSEGWVCQACFPEFMPPTRREREGSDFPP